MNHYDNPTFNLKAVVQETGLKPDTLRVWERRYGLPSPSRSDGKHRLYSQRDINILKWLIERQQEGLSISRAVTMWQQLSTEGHDPLTVNLADHAPVVPTTTMTLDAIATLRQSWLTACLNFDELHAEHILGQAFSLYSLPLACVELVQKGLAEIGEGWVKREVSVQQEHFASGLVVRWLEALIAATPSATKTGKILIGCPAEEEHVISILMLNLLLRRHGYEVVYLGANIPLAFMEQTLTNIKPNIVVMTAQTWPAAANLVDVAELLHRLNLPFAFGGVIFNEFPPLRQRISGQFLGENLMAALQTIETMIVIPPAATPFKPMTPLYNEAWHHFRERQAMLDMAIWQSLNSMESLRNLLPALNLEVRRHLMAALKLEALNLLNVDLSWLTPNFNLTAEQLTAYWQAYRRACQSHLDGRGQLLYNWLDMICLHLQRNSSV